MLEQLLSDQNDLNQTSLKKSKHTFSILNKASTTRKYGYTPKKKKKIHFNNIRVIAIVDTKYCNKIWDNSFVQQKISLQ